jgi:hypothetical protein
MWRLTHTSVARALVFAAFAALLGVEACTMRSPDLPNAISDDEYSVYSAWITHHFKEQPDRLLLASRTLIFDAQGMCNAKSLESNRHISGSQLQSLHRLGEAEFPVHTGKFRAPPFKLPWKFEESEPRFANPPGPYSLIAFSRVAFNRDKSEGLFAVSNSCGGLCGGGGLLVATRKVGQWEFEAERNCSWDY